MNTQTKQSLTIRLWALAIIVPALLLAGCSSPLNSRSHQLLEAAAVEESGDIEEGSSLPLPAEPDFEQLSFDRNLDINLTHPPRGAYRVGPGDVLDIEVAENEATRAQTKVLPDGMLHYDVAPGLNVKGKTLGDISNSLGHLLKDDYINPVVSINVAKADSQRVWLLGQVKTPGAYPIRKPTTLIDAISQSGGMLTSQVGFDAENQDVVDLERAILIRDDTLVPIDFEGLVERGDMSQNVYIKGGDYIYLPSVQARSVYVLGAVNSPGPILYDSGATLLTAVAAAGGPRRDAIVTKALLIRGGTRNPEVAVVNIQALMKGRTADLSLKGGDIVWVPRSPWTNLKNYTEAVLVTAAQAVAVQEGLGLLGTSGSAGVTIQAGGN